MGIISKEAAIEFCVQKHVVYLFKEFLKISEEISNDAEIERNKLIDNLPKEYEAYVLLANSLPPEKQNLIRKKILDLGNETKRNLVLELKEIDKTIN